MSAEILVTDPEVLRRRLRKLIDALGAQSLQSTRQNALERLGRFGEPAVPALTRALDYDEPLILANARRALDRIAGRPIRTHRLTS